MTLIPVATLTALSLIAPRPAAALAQSDLANAQSITDETFSGISSIRELSSGQLVMADLGAKALYVIDPATRGVRRVGREGSGPTDYRLPVALFRFTADSVLAWDVELRRFLILDPAGRPARSMLPPQSLALRQPGGADRFGRIYFSDYEVAGGTGRPDSAFVVRWTPTGNAIDTLGRVALGPTVVVTRTRGRSVNRFAIEIPFTAPDDWEPMADGAIAILRVEPHRLDRWSPTGDADSGPTIPYARIPVTQADRESIQAFPGAEYPWPETKAPFMPRRTQFAGPDEIWIRRPTTAGDSLARFDVLGPGGTVRSDVVLAPAEKLLGLSPEWIYVARVDPDGLETLVRYPRTIGR